MPWDSISQFELLVLLATAHIGDDAYGVSIANAIEHASGQQTPLASVYRALRQLEAKGLVRTRLGDPTNERGGRAKRFFKVTGKGLKAVKDTQRAFTALWSGIPQLKGGTA